MTAPRNASVYDPATDRPQEVTTATKCWLGEYEPATSPENTSADES